MILVDTSVWVRARSGRHPELARDLAEVVRSDGALRHDLVHLELLLGEGGPSRKQLLDDYQRLRGAPVIPHTDVVKFARTHDLSRQGIGAVDLHSSNRSALEAMGAAGSRYHRRARR